MPGHRVLVVEDDHGLRDVLARGLRQAGFEVTTVADGSTALRTARPGEVDGVVLDIGLPDADGRDVCVALRARGIDVPVLFLTARGALGDRLSGFASGGDDYLPKPFAFPELVARLTALLRRAVDQVTVVGDLELDPVSHALLCGDSRVALSPTEFRLLARLIGAPGAVVRRHELVTAGWPHGAIVSENTLDQYVSKLRRKLAEVGSDHGIEAARGVGFRLV
ncbi:MAG: response regulator transcription factor [Jatrophihabitans sp.]|uniref:response regulator transcription factor n=1 Tax=Jatrophihabitans sp. TaxID=1932789 RepID=UPI003F808D96